MRRFPPALATAAAFVFAMPAHIPALQAADAQASLTNSIGMKLVPVAAGSFVMGQDGPEADYRMVKHPAKFDDADWDEKPAHKVILSNAFYMGANSYGQAADGTVGAKARWAPFANGAKLAVVEAGFYHTCFTLRGASSGLVRCAGFNLQGTLGGGTRGGSSSTPVTVVFGSGGTGGDSKPPALAPQNRPTTLRPSPTARPTVRSKRGGRGRRLSALAA